jgi:hypothetical protein
LHSAKFRQHVIGHAVLAQEVKIVGGELELRAGARLPVVGRDGAEVGADQLRPSFDAKLMKVT